LASHNVELHNAGRPSVFMQLNLSDSTFKSFEKKQNKKKQQHQPFIMKVLHQKRTETFQSKHLGNSKTITTTTTKKKK
jgi:hypothetical protein